MDADMPAPMADTSAMRLTCHKGHRYYIGGLMDGCVDHLVYAAPSDYPQTIGTVLGHGQRSWYELDYNASDGTEAVYRCIGIGREFPLSPTTEGAANA